MSELTQEERVLALMVELREELVKMRPQDNGVRARYVAVTVTELEKLFAFFVTFLKENPELES